MAKPDDDVLRALGALLHPVQVGGQLADGITVVGISTEAGPQLRVEAQGHPMLVELAIAVPEDPRRFAARTARVLVSYRGAGNQSVDPQLGKRVCELVAERIAVNESALAGPPSEIADAPRLREVEAQRLLEPAWDGARPYYTASPYVGCLVGCRFCYAQSRVGSTRALASLPIVPWGSYVDVRINAADVLRRELETVSTTPIKFCPIVSDPYQAPEVRFGLTRACLEVLAAAPSRPVLVLTRCETILRDLDVLCTLPQAYAGVSIPTIDDAVRRRFEPRAADIPTRLRILQALRKRGIRTVAVVQPQLPGSAAELAAALRTVADSVSLDILRSVEGAADDFAAYPEAATLPWQQTHAASVREHLVAHGVSVWDGELPPGV